MTDTLTTEQRSSLMARIRSKDTKPELVIRRLLHGLGYRYRLHRRDLPGTPDLVFMTKRKVIFVHGCFWHRHQDPSCTRARIPKSRQEFWIPKLEGNALRDEMNLHRLTGQGWKCMVIWECQLADLPTITKRLQQFLQGERDEIS
jgi:DNA mismatch endonuclease, patch repair protein